MKIKKKVRILASFMAVMVIIVMISAGGCENQEAGFKKEYRLQVTVGSTTYWGMGAAKFSELVKEKTGGKIIVKPYYGSQLLKGAQLNSSQMVATGAIDCAFESTINTAPVIPEMNIFSLPFFINTFEKLDALENNETGKRIFTAMRQKGLEPLAWGENGFRQLTNNRRPVLVPDDLKGLRIRVVGSPIFIDIFRQLGADPISMNWGDAVTAFQQGTVDGQENPAGILTAVQIHQYNRYGTFWNYLADPLILYWNKKEWDRFPQDIRNGIKEAALEASIFEKALCRAGLDGETSLRILKDDFNYDILIKDPVGFLEENGMEIRFLDEQMRANFQKAVKPVFDKWAEKIGRELVETAKKEMGLKGRTED